jgi:hypothetical protein
MDPAACCTPAAAPTRLPASTPSVGQPSQAPDQPLSGAPEALVPVTAKATLVILHLLDIQRASTFELLVPGLRVVVRPKIT